MATFLPGSVLIPYENYSDDTRLSQISGTSLVCWTCHIKVKKSHSSSSLHLCALSLYSQSGKTSYRQISWSFEAARFGFRLFQSLRILTGTSAAVLPRCLSNFRALRSLIHTISRLRDFTIFGGKTSYLLVNRGPESRFASTAQHHHETLNFMLHCWPYPGMCCIEYQCDYTTTPISCYTNSDIRFWLN